MNMQDPQLSVVIPAYNAERYIEDCVRSVLAQEACPAYEIIVVDDGSTDGTGLLLQRLAAQEPRIHLIQTENGGTGSATNLGVEAASGEIIIFLDNDDKMLPGRLQHQGTFLLNHPDASASFGNMVISNSNASPLDVWNFPDREDDNYHEIHMPFNRFMADGCYVCNPASAVKRADYLAIGMQCIDRRLAVDMDLWCRLAVQGYRFYVTRRKYTWLRRENHGNQMSGFYAYQAPTLFFAKQLRVNGDKLSPEERQKAQRLLDRRADMYLRYLWAFDRAGLEPAIAELADIVGSNIIRRWTYAMAVPSWVGRVLRKARHAL